MRIFWFICFLVVQTRKYIWTFKKSDSHVLNSAKLAAPLQHILTSTLVFHFTNKHWIDTKAEQNWPCFKIFVGNFSNLEISKSVIQLVDFKLQNMQQETTYKIMVLWNKALLMADRCWPKCSNLLNPVGHILTFSFFFFNCNQNLI